MSGEIHLPHLKAYRTKRVWSQVMLADYAGVCKETIIHLENHGGAKVGTVHLLADALEVTPEQLVHESPK